MLSFVNEKGAPLKRILFVDDDPDIRRLVKKVLETQKQHFQLVVVDNGLTALDELKATHYDVLISDANMPHFSGFDLIRSVNKSGLAPNMAIAMLTGRREKEDIQQAIQLKVDDYIVKPIDPTLLIDKVHKLAQKKAKPLKHKKALKKRTSLQASVEAHFEITELTPQGCTATCALPLTVGAELFFYCEEFEHIEMDIPLVRVVACQSHHSNKGQYSIQVEFLEMTDPTLDQLKDYIRRTDTAA